LTIEFLDTMLREDTGDALSLDFKLLVGFVIGLVN
jgi:hypothetical protein